MRERPEWEAIVPWLPKRLKTGEQVSFELVMRKKIDGQWIYRWPTAEESVEYLRDEAW